MNQNKINFNIKNVLRVACPKCSAVAGEPCLLSRERQDGRTYRFSSHIERHRLKSGKSLIKQRKPILLSKTYSFQEKRQVNKRAYKAWTSLDDKELLKLWSTEKNISKLGVRFNRSNGAIRSRLAKLLHF